MTRGRDRIAEVAGVLLAVLLVVAALGAMLALADAELAGIAGRRGLSREIAPTD